MRKLQAAGIALFFATAARLEEPALSTLLARQCVAEVSLSPRVEVPRSLRLEQKLSECRLMWHVLGAKVDYDRARLGALIPRYNTLFKRGEASSRRWVLELQPDGDQPPSWPSNERWARHRTTWLAIVDAAEAFVDDPGAHPCSRADHFGGRCDDNRHACDPVPACWKRQWCGQPRPWFAQAYWQRRRCAVVVPGPAAR